MVDNLEMQFTFAQNCLVVIAPKTNLDKKRNCKVSDCMQSNGKPKILGCDQRLINILKVIFIASEWPNQSRKTRNKCEISVFCTHFHNRNLSPFCSTKNRFFSSNAIIRALAMTRVHRFVRLRYDTMIVLRAYGNLRIAFESIIRPLECGDEQCAYMWLRVSGERTWHCVLLMSAEESVHLKHKGGRWRPNLFQKVEFEQVFILEVLGFEL